VVPGYLRGSEQHITADIWHHKLRCVHDLRKKCVLGYVQCENFLAQRKFDWTHSYAFLFQLRLTHAMFGKCRIFQRSAKRI
jgi:hypothetical protein